MSEETSHLGSQQDWPFCNDTFISKDGKFCICQLKDGHEERGREKHAGVELTPMNDVRPSLFDGEYGYGHYRGEY